MRPYLSAGGLTDRADASANVARLPAVLEDFGAEGRMHRLALHKGVEMNYYFYSLYALATSHDVSNLTAKEHNEYARFLEALQQEDCQ